MFQPITPALMLSMIDFSELIFFIDISMDYAFDAYYAGFHAGLMLDYFDAALFREGWAADCCCRRRS